MLIEAGRKAIKGQGIRMLNVKNRIAYIIKYNNTIYAMYYNLFSLCINVLKIFIKPDDKLILFNSFAGRKFDDSPKAIFEAMKQDLRFNDFRLVWAFHDPSKFEVVGADKIKTDCLKYFKTALAARVWITNSSVERGLNFTGKNTLYFNTWHGTTIKKMGKDISSDSQSFRTKGGKEVDVRMSQGKYETDIFSRTTGIAKDKFLEVGLPRNDILFNYTKEMKEVLKRKLEISTEKKVILYCPTFREYEKGMNYEIVLKPPIDLSKWKSKLGEKFILLFRAHYEVSKVMGIKEDSIIRNMTDYPDINDLMIVSDVLISDYSSVFFDYSITGKPMFHFTYDYDTYATKRGMYFDIREHLDGGSTEDELIELLLNYDELSAKKKTEQFRNKFVNYYGNAAKAAVDCIANRLSL